MPIQIQTVDENGKPVKGATISFYKGSKLINAVKVPDNTGILYFDLEGDSELFEYGNTIRATAFGYNPAASNADAVRGDWVFTMAHNNQEILLTAGAVGGALLLYGLATRNNKKVGRFDTKDIVPFIIPVAAVVGGVILYNKFFGKTEEDKKRDEALSDDIANAAAQNPPQMTDSEIAITANQLVEDLTYAHPFSDEEFQLDAAHQLTKPQTLADLLRLIKQYGKHVITYFGIPAGSFTLEETVTRKMEAAQIEEINNYYAAQGINFSF